MKQLLKNYQSTNKPVDDVLIDAINHEFAHREMVISRKNREYDLACEHEMKLIMENKQLREALGKVESECYGNSTYFKVAEIARQALKKEPQ